MNRHNMRPSHLHIAVQAPGYHKLVTMFFPEDCTYLQSDCVFAAKKSLAVVCVLPRCFMEPFLRAFNT